jgi:hypothetical protein
VAGGKVVDLTGRWTQGWLPEQAAEELAIRSGARDFGGHVHQTFPANVSSEACLGNPRLDAHAAAACCGPASAWLTLAGGAWETSLASHLTGRWVQCAGAGQTGTPKRSRISFKGTIGRSVAPLRAGGHRQVYQVVGTRANTSAARATCQPADDRNHRRQRLRETVQGEDVRVAYTWVRVDVRVRSRRCWCGWPTWKNAKPWRVRVSGHDGATVAAAGGCYWCGCSAGARHQTTVAQLDGASIAKPDDIDPLD